MSATLSTLQTHFIMYPSATWFITEDSLHWCSAQTLIRDQNCLANGETFPSK